jgi:hypothetical protein
VKRQDSGTPFEGDWVVVNATLPDGSFGYSGRIAVRRVAATYQLEWQISAGRYVGIGLPLGAHLLVACGEQPAGLGLALCTLRAGAAPTLEWSTFELAGAVGTGRLTSPWAGSFIGEHQIALDLPDGRLYGEWRLAIRRQGALYRLAWRKNDVTHFEGLALETAHGLALAWYPDIAQLALLDYHADAQRNHRLSAVWALGDYTALGTEVLVR